MGLGSERLSPEQSVPSQFNHPNSVAEEPYSLLYEVDSESIANEFEIGTYSKKHDLDNRLKIGISGELIHLTHSMN